MKRAQKDSLKSPTFSKLRKKILDRILFLRAVHSQTSNKKAIKWSD